jgi:cell division protein FtsI/penicillin-binding protein 2
MRSLVAMSAHPRRTALTVVAGLLLAGPLLTACGSTSAPGPVARSYLSDWARRDWPAMRRLVASPPADFAAVNGAALTDLSVRQASYTAGRLRTRGSSASEPVTERLQLPGVGPVTIKTRLSLVSQSGTWRVRWSPATIAPALQAGDRLALQVTWPARAAILGAGGVPLTTQAPEVIVGVEGQRIKKAAAVGRALVQAGASPAQVKAALTAAKAKPAWFEPVFTVSQARYRQLKPAIYPIPGTVFQNTSTRTAITPGLTAHLVGAVGPVTAQELHALGTPYNAASIVGQSGLEQTYQRQLAGTPGATITVVRPSGTVAATIAQVAARPGQPVRTTIEPRVQRAAETALASVHKSAALIAVNASTGDVLAAVSLPAANPFDQALGGAFPPGSSFKVITSTALIGHGLSPSSAASCPTTITVDGEIFHNAEGTAPVSNLLHAFAESCNTAFIGLAERHLTPADFPRTAAEYGIGSNPQPGLPAFGGKVPTPTDEADLAATTIGQGQVLVSPLAMVMVAAGVDTGVVRVPQLVSGAPDSKEPPLTRLPGRVVSDLHQMMAQVVATGTASGRGLPPGTYAKTGTAQYGSGNPLPTDAWLIGFNGPIAFAMVVHDGGEGGPTDGPIVARFLDLLHQG